MMRLSEAGLAFIKRWEGFRSHAYQDSGGVWTVGYGHTGPDVHAGLVVTEPYAAHLLAADLTHVEATVNALITVNLLPGEFDALCSFAYNLGCGALAHSDLLRDLNAGHFALAAAQFPLWCHAAGVTVPGLLARRRAEALLFTTKTKEHS